eukprot:CAMPEP_0118684340 /NCGR_PEP_ID=MMETSP0800-20121206/6587_1 /TAXON_ID=210618 ORGANISM="Striatella unipunctata, Strain CCMP2910" /NCGR_SAMPLE_ID=MMETSP0800 /ASSEMBLY_ACC=CAM_ASM_000638 /LENGTH=200 /DNA_ID=CAMNT_0006581031 /DNA_START=626 /DNA_END=1228 /DNA_ORIENTATION=+
MPKPCVAPVMMKIPSSDELEIDLSPRLVAYFEITIYGMERPEKTADGNRATVYEDQTSECIAVGVSNYKFPCSSKMPGWERFSYGYHGDDGGIYHGRGEQHRAYGPRFGPGDTIGCGLDYVHDTLFFTLNGRNLGTAFVVRMGKERWYPTVGLDSSDWIHCNFGQEPFVFDLKGYSNQPCHKQVIDASMNQVLKHTPKNS